MADASGPVISTPAHPGQPYDATAGPGSVAGWEKLAGGQADLDTGQLTGDDFPDSGPWRQC